MPRRESSTLIVVGGDEELKQEEEKTYESKYYRSTAQFTTTPRELSSVDVVVSGIPEAQVEIETSSSATRTEHRHGEEPITTSKSHYSHHTAPQSQVKVEVMPSGSHTVRRQGGVDATGTSYHSRYGNPQGHVEVETRATEDSDELNRIIAESRSRRRRMKEEYFSTS